MSWTRNNNGGSSTLVIEAPATVGSSRTDSAPAPPPPPPPPPPPASDGRAPASKARNTVEMPTGSRPRPPGSSTNGQDYSSYEPPAAIQNAMMTRDKKPFTYTPGMGGKLDLSQIRSPRMARRVAKNANDEGIEAPAAPRTNLTAEPRPVSAGPGLYAQVAVPVFPTNQPVPPLRSTPVNIAPSASVRTPTSPDDSTVTARPNSMPETPTSPQVTLAKAPTPWLQNRSKPREELPEWAKRTGNLGPSTPTRTTSGSQQPPSPPSSPPEQQSQTRERIIPLRIEDRPSVFAARNEAERLGRSTKQPQQQQQQSQPTANRHRERWGNNGARPSPETPPSSTGGTYIVPIMVGAGNAGGNEDDDEDDINDGYSSGTRVIIQREPPARGQLRGEPAPVQSRSFRVLQKITDTDVDRTDGPQARQLLLAENDKVLMNKVKEQVDGDGVYLHREEDPRYRGAAIPSRAFRYLLNMTDSADRSAATAATPNTIATATTTTTTTSAPPGASAATHARQHSGDSQRLDQPRRTAAASEQQVPEPKKYTGSAIPSKSFRILQAMTSPENIAARREYGEAVETGAGEGVARPSHFSFANDNPSPSMVDDYRVRASSPLSSTLESRRHRLPFASSPIVRYSEGDRGSNQLHPSQSQSSLSSSSSSSSLSSSSSSSSLFSSSSLTTSSTTDGSANLSPIPHPIYRSSLYEMSGVNRRHYHLHYRRNRSRRQREANNPISRRSRNDELSYVSSPANVEQTPHSRVLAPTTNARRRPTEKQLGHDGNCVCCLESRLMRASDIAADSGIGSQQRPNNGSIVEAEPPPQPPWYACPSEEKGREDFKVVGLEGGSGLTGEIRARNEPRWNRIDIATTRERTAAYDGSIPMNISTPLVNGAAITPPDDTSEEANEDEDEDSSSLTEDDASQTTDDDDDDEDDSDSYVAYSTGPCPENTGGPPADNSSDKVKDMRVRGGGASPNEIGSDGWKCESSSDESVAKCKFGSDFRSESSGDAIWSTERDESTLEVPATIETMTAPVPGNGGADVRGIEGTKVSDVDEEEEVEDDDEAEEEDAEEEDEEDEKIKESDKTLDSARPPITRKINGYKRTQTHSRLFRLLSNPRDREAINGEENHTQTPSAKQTNPRRSLDYSRITTKNVPAPLTAVKIDSPNYPYEEFKRDVSERIMEGPLPDWRFGRRVKCPRIDDRKNVPEVPNGRWSDRSSGRAFIGTGNTDGSDSQQCLLSQFKRDLLLSCEHSPIGKPRYHRAGAKRT